MIPEEIGVKSPKIYINNATEEEISNLSGISVILAKKIIKNEVEINISKNGQIFINGMGNFDKILKDINLAGIK